MAELRHITTEAIILKTNLAGEINKNFTFISPSIGIQAATAFGAAKIKSRFCSSVQAFVKAKLFLYKNPKTNLFKLEDITDINTNDFIKKDLKFIYLASFFSDVFLNSFMGLEEFKNYYYLLLYSTELLHESCDVAKTFLFFISKFLFLSGYNFNLINCNKCGKEFDAYSFDLQAGGIFCDYHAVHKNFNITKNAADIWKDFLEKKYLHLKKVLIDKNDFNLLAPIIIFIINEIFGKELKTVKYLKEIL